jgi:hypothetical protein
MYIVTEEHIAVAVSKGICILKIIEKKVRIFVVCVL